MFIASQSDIDDLIPILTAYQIEWNKMHARLGELKGALGAGAALPSVEEIAKVLGVPEESVDKLIEAFGQRSFRRRSPRARRAAARSARAPPRRVVFAVPARGPALVERRRAGVRATDPAAQAGRLLRVVQHARDGQPHRRLRARTRAGHRRLRAPARSRRSSAARSKRRPPRGTSPICPRFSTTCSAATSTRRPTSAWPRCAVSKPRPGLVHLSGPGHIDVDAQILELSRLDPERLDPRLRVPGIERLTRSDAYILNIDYPLGMAAYHHLSRVGQAVGELRGVYVMGKAATLNGRVGDVALSGVVYDEHTRNTVLFKNAFTAADVRPYLRYGSVFDNQSALTVRSAFLQNKNYMNAFYRDGYSVLEMEAGPFLNAIYELARPRRPSPQDEIVNLASSARSKSASSTTRRIRRIRASSRSSRRASATSASTAPTRARSPSCGASSSGRPRVEQKKRGGRSF